MSILSLAHVCIKTTDLDATSKFYCDALGLKKFFNFTKKGKIVGFYMKASNETFVEVFLADEVSKVEKQVLNHFCLQVDSIEAVRNTLIEHGYAPRAISMGADGSPQFWMEDPTGLSLEFQEYRPNSSQYTGRNVEMTW